MNAYESGGFMSSKSTSNSAYAGSCSISEFLG